MSVYVFMLHVLMAYVTMLLVPRFVLTALDVMVAENKKAFHNTAQDSRVYRKG
jgi:hypothetical protein